MRLWISRRRRVASARAGCTRDIPLGIRVGIKSRSCRRSPRTSPSTAAIAASVRPAARSRWPRCRTSTPRSSGHQLTALIAYLTVVCRMPRLGGVSAGMSAASCRLSRFGSWAGLATRDPRDKKDFTRARSGRSRMWPINRRQIGNLGY